MVIGEQTTIPAQDVKSYSEGTPGIIDVRLPKDAEAAKLCQAAAKPKGSDVPPPDIGVSDELIQVGRQMGINPPDEGMLEETDRTLAWQRWATAIKSLQDFQERRGKLIPIDTYRKRLRDLADQVIAQMADLHGLARDVKGLTHQQRIDMRTAIAAWMTITRQRMSAGIHLNAAPLPAVAEIADAG